MHDLVEAIRHAAEIFPHAYDIMNLNAQAEMAYWAKWASFASFASILLSAAALIGLFISLRQTRAAIVDTREIGEAQTRAFVIITGAECSIYNAGSRQKPIDRIKFNVGAKICGATPALDISVEYKIMALFSNASKEDGYSSDRHYVGGMSPGSEFDPVGISWPLGDEHDDILNANRAFELRGVITYQCAVAKGLRLTEFAFFFGENGKLAGEGRDLLPTPIVEGVRST